jgi:hypothetical protein
MTREFYRPSEALGATMETAPTVPGSEIYRYTNRMDRPVAEVFGGKRAKPDWYIQFQTEERREEKIAEWIANEEDNSKRAAKRRAENNAGHTLEVGDVLSGSWGYDQTNVDFYQIVEVPSKCFVVARKIGGKTVRENGSAIYVVPSKDSWCEHKGEAKRYKAGPDNCITIESFLHPSKTSWTEEHYETHWMYGH